MLIVIEGADGCGKTTVAAALAQHTGAALQPFPDDTAVTGPLIRAYLRKEWGVQCADEDRLNAWDDKMSALAFQALQVANRMERMVTLRAAVRHPTNHVVCARYWQSSWVYGQLDGLPRSFLEEVHSTMAGPDLSVLLDVSAEESMARRAARDGAQAHERYEGKLELTRRVVNLYRELWTTEAPSWVVVDATRSVDTIVPSLLAKLVSL